MNDVGAAKERSVAFQKALSGVLRRIIYRTEDDPMHVNDVSTVNAITLGDLNSISTLALPPIDPLPVSQTSSIVLP